MQKVFSLLLLTSALVILPGLCFAYTETPVGDIVAKITPANPAPGATTTITVNSYGEDLSASDISWLVNEEKVLSGIGKTFFQITAPKIGSTKSITVTVATPTGKTLSDEIIFAPQDLDLIWQALTYTPAFYRGKALPTSEAKIRLTALPNFYIDGAKVSSAKLVYKWQKNGNALPYQSGYGKNSITITGEKLFGTNTISVQVSNLDGSVTGEKTVTIPVLNPKIVFYEQKTGGQMATGQALAKNLGLATDQVIIKAEPYYFPIADFSSLKFDWFINKTKANNPDNEPSLLYKPLGSGARTSIVEILITDSKNLLQQANSAFNITSGLNSY